MPEVEMFDLSKDLDRDPGVTPYSSEHYGIQEMPVTIDGGTYGNPKETHTPTGQAPA